VWNLVHLRRCVSINQAYYMSILKQWHAAVWRKRSESWPSDWILHYGNTAVHKPLSVEQFLTQKLVTELGHPSCYCDLAPNDFWLFPKIKSALKGQRFHDTEARCDNCTESYFTTEDP
jgi:hypothetical protein